METRGEGDGLAIGFDYRRSDIFSRAVFREEFEERSVAEILFEVGVAVQILGVDFGHGQTVAAKMPGKFKESDVFFANAVENADGAGLFIGEADDLAPGAAELALDGLDALGRGVEVLLEECF